ncbi:MAG: aminotransferase class I/II-fold pyridoxal phosphate-dependent enzyme [Chloroflexi bacterium]|nr:aminotransferase class I/II-fold pyridoxal phosphate-dependent enzyme [Chloroflexota bacterium]MBP7044484.1 aminotransferase class I/II-fold pyridoxal phosphate-dependent enzyme [Chloroflexota bacterium]
MEQVTSTDRLALTPDMLWDIDHYREQGLYFYLEATQELLPNGRVNVINYGEMIMLGGYSYLGLIGHPKINAAAKAAIDHYGTGTYGVRLLAGSLQLHNELEARIAEFKHADAAITMSSGYVTNLATISSLLRKGDTVICDKLNHASIVDGCLLSMAKFIRFRHNDMEHLELRLRQADKNGRVLVIADSVFSMDGDIINLPEVSRLCKKYGAYLMIDEAHSVGVIGETGHGIEEHFGMPSDTIDIKMGTLSKTIPSAGGYVAGNHKLIDFLKHEARAFIFSAAVPPASAAAAKTAFDVIEEEPWRVQKIQNNYLRFANKLKEAGYNLLFTETAIVPVVCGSTDSAARLAKHCRDNGIFVQAIVAPVVPEGLARLRACISAAHTIEDIDYCADVIIEGGKKLGII